MAKANSTASTQQSEEVTEDRNRNEPIFQRFTNYSDEAKLANLPGGVVMEFADMAKSIAEGAALIIEMRHFEAMSEDFRSNGDENSPRMLKSYDHDRLQRMAIVSLSVLVEKAEEIMNWAFEHRTPEGKREPLSQAAFSAGVRVVE